MPDATHAKSRTVMLERVDAARGMQRFYQLTVAPTLFGETAFQREWGRIGHRGRYVQRTFGRCAEANVALEAWLHRKEKRGYSVVFIVAE